MLFIILFPMAPLNRSRQVVVSHFNGHIFVLKHIHYLMAIFSHITAYYRFINMRVCTIT